MTSKPFITRLLYLARELRSKELFGMLKAYCRGSILDVGGWDFYLTACKKGVPHISWTTLESEMGHVLDIADRRFRLACGDGRNMCFGDDQFDTVLCIQVLEHVFEPLRMLEEMARVLKSGGYAILVVPQTANLHMIPHHYQNFTRYWIIAAMDRAKLEIVELKSLGGAWSTLASRLVFFFLQSVRLGRVSYPEAKRNLGFYLLYPLMVVFALVSIPICLLLSLGDLPEEPNNHLCVVRKPHSQSSCVR